MFTLFIYLVIYSRVEVGRVCYYIITAVQVPYSRSFITVIEGSDCSEQKICSVIGFAKCVLPKWRRQLGLQQN